MAFASVRISTEGRGPTRSVATRKAARRARASRRAAALRIVFMSALKYLSSAGP